MDRDLQEYNYIYFNNPTRPHAKQYVCVKECPTRNYESIVQCAPNSKVLGERDNCIQNPTFIVYQSVPCKWNSLKSILQAICPHSLLPATALLSLSEKHFLFSKDRIATAMLALSLGVLIVLLLPDRLYYLPFR